MSISMALFSPQTQPPPLFPSSPPKSHFTLKPHHLSLRPPKSPLFLLSTTKASADNGAGTSPSAATALEPEPSQKVPEPPKPVVGANGSVEAVETEEAEILIKFEDPKWVGGTWDLNQFQKEGKTDWDAVIDSEARRRKWLESNPETSTNDAPIVFDTSIIPWWAWIKRFHLPEAERLNGRAAMIGFFMAYLVDSFTGVGLVDQMSNFFCKTLLFIAVAGVLVIRKNEDLDNLKKLLDETTFYDKQWQATWQDETPGSSKK